MAITAPHRPEHLTDDAIPIIDVGPYLRGVSGALERTATELRDALERIGFFVVVNHDVPEELMVFRLLSR